MKKNNIICVFVPDVHGRTFWKDIKKFDCDIIFLGDYLDPYDFENISKKKALDNFKEIIEYRKNHDNVTLLLGNHDCEYAISKRVCNCRCDDSRYDDIRQLFIDNAQYFSFATIRNYANRKYLISHAGVNPYWIKNYKDFFNLTYIVNLKCNQCDDLTYKQFCSSLCDVSGYRGGLDAFSSFVWSDIREFMNMEDKTYMFADLLGYTQICGHTRLKEKAIQTGPLTCIDLKKIVLLDDQGNLKNKDLSPLETVYL